MEFVILKLENVDKLEFVYFWSSQYYWYYGKDNLYDENIGKELTEERIWILFQWKNGKPLSSRKKDSVWRNFINEKEIIPPQVNQVILESYLNKPGGAIWRIFWLHCNYPTVYPIYDQNVHRAMAKIKNWEDIEIPNYNPSRIKMYINEYLPFWQEFNELPPKRVDEALWSYGRFLKLKYKL